MRKKNPANNDTILLLGLAGFGFYLYKSGKLDDLLGGGGCPKTLADKDVLRTLTSDQVYVYKDTTKKLHPVMSVERFAALGLKWDAVKTVSEACLLKFAISAEAA